VGLAEVKITDMKRTLDIELELLRKNPSLFMCHEPTCVECRLSWEFSTGKLAGVLFHDLRRRLLGDVLFALRTRLNRNGLPK